MSFTTFKTPNKLNLTGLSFAKGDLVKQKRSKLAKDKIAFTCLKCGEYYGIKKMSEIENICVNCEN